MVEYFSKYVWGATLKGKHADEAVGAMLDRAWREHGVPYAVPPDNGKELKNALYNTKKERYNVQKKVYQLCAPPRQWALRANE